MADGFLKNIGEAIGGMGHSASTGIGPIIAPIGEMMTRDGGIVQAMSTVTGGGIAASHAAVDTSVTVEAAMDADAGVDANVVDAEVETVDATVDESEAVDVDDASAAGE